MHFLVSYKVVYSVTLMKVFNVIWDLLGYARHLHMTGSYWDSNEDNGLMAAGNQIKYPIGS